MTLLDEQENSIKDNGFQFSKGLEKYINFTLSYNDTRKRGLHRRIQRDLEQKKLSSKKRELLESWAQEFRDYFHYINPNLNRPDPLQKTKKPPEKPSEKLLKIKSYWPKSNYTLPKAKPVVKREVKLDKTTQDYSNFIARFLDLSIEKKVATFTKIDFINVFAKGKEAIQKVPLETIYQLDQENDKRFIELMLIKHMELLWVHIFMEKWCHEYSIKKENETSKYYLRSFISKFDHLIHKKFAGVSKSQLDQLFHEPAGHKTAEQESKLYESAYIKIMEPFRGKAGLPNKSLNQNELQRIVTAWSDALMSYPKMVEAAIESKSIHLKSLFDSWHQELLSLKALSMQVTHTTIQNQLQNLHDISHQKYLKYLSNTLGHGHLLAPSRLNVNHFDYYNELMHQEVMDELVEDIKDLRVSLSYFDKERLQVEACEYYIEEMLVSLLKSGVTRMILNVKPGIRGYYSSYDREAFITLITNSISSSLRSKMKPKLKSALVPRSQFTLDEEKRHRMNQTISIALNKAEKKYQPFFRTHL